METRKRCGEAEQEMVLSLYEDSGKTSRKFSETEGVESRKLERWLRARTALQTREHEVVRLVEVEEKPERPEDAKSVRKNRIHIGSGDDFQHGVRESYPFQDSDKPFNQG